jgi:glucose/arabinose dehydrogenase
MSRPLWQLVGLAVLVLVFVGGAGAAGACKLFLNCHLHGSQSGLARYQGWRAPLKGLPANLAVTIVARGFSYPTDFDFLADGRILIAERNGTIKSVSSSGRPGSRPFLDLSSRVATSYFRGILGLKVDPDFAAHPFVYVAYTPTLAGEEPTGPTVVRISRFRVANGRAVASSERVIVGGDDAKPCEELPSSADCLPSHLDVDGADVVFAPDGTLFVSTGYGGGGGEEHVEDSAFLSQNRDSLAGKVLHIDRDGHGLPSNPFWDGDPDHNRSKVWATGFRNPFRMAMLPGRPTTLAVGNVGWHSWESLFRVTRGSDSGWPCYEGGHRTPEYRDTERCTYYYRAQPQMPNVPWVAVKHPPGIAAITAGGPLRRATQLPRNLQNDYVFADWGQGSLTVIPLSVTSDPPQTRLAESAAGPVRLRVGPDGALYYLAANGGELRRITRRTVINRLKTDLQEGG